MYQPFLTVAIAGPTGSGKSTLTHAVQEYLTNGKQNGGTEPLRIGILPLDWFYRDLSRAGFTTEERSKLERGLTLTPERATQLGLPNYESSIPFSFDHPESLDWPDILSSINRIKEGREMTRPAYDFTRHGYNSELPVNTVPAAQRLLLVEGIYGLDPRLPADLRIYVETDALIRYQRRLTRDMTERGRTADSVEGQWHSTVKPMEERFVEPTKKNADLVVSWNNDPQEKLKAAVDQVAARISVKLDDERLAEVPLGDLATLAQFLSSST